MTFTDWLVRQLDREDAIGDFARDSGSDPNWPARGDLSDLRAHVPDVAHGILEEAWAEYEQEAVTRNDPQGR